MIATCEFEQGDYMFVCQMRDVFFVFRIAFLIVIEQAPAGIFIRISTCLVNTCALMKYLLFYTTSFCQEVFATLRHN